MAGVWMAYQPIVSFREKRIFGYEALLRSAEPSFPHPGAIIEAAEHLNRLAELGRTIRGKAWLPMEEADPAIRLFVNLHPADLLDDSLYDPETLLSQHAKRVVLELTERAALEDIKDVKSRIDRLRALGYWIAIDDLGSGYSGLGLFTLLQPEVVKLDMGLIRNCHLEETKRKLVGSMISLCRDLRIQVVAEGIENKEERDALVELGCDLLQGYFFARPAAPFPTIRW
jgi:EAL domain-containing protein (putative c-di-GMP-specific phosphodiesterase class I)